MFVIDTNILVDAANDESAFHLPCRALLANCRDQSGAWFLTWGVCYEFLRVATHPKIFDRPLSAANAWRFIEDLIGVSAVGVLTPTDRHKLVAAKVFAEMPSLAGNIMHDAETAILMREHGIKTIYTRDMDFHRFGFLQVIDPTTALAKR